MTEPLESSSDQKPPYIATFLAILAVISLCLLGTWQWQRGEQKQQRLEQIAQRQQNQIMPLSSLLQQQDRRDLPFEARGQLRHNQLFLLDNRIESGQVGYQVLVPMQTDYGLLMVNLGWVKAPAYRDQLPSIVVPEGRFTLTGTSMLPTINPMVTETIGADATWPIVLQSLDLALIAEFLSAPVLPLVMQLDPEHALGFERNWVPVVMPPQKHYAYAVQWFGLAIACLVIYLIAMKKRIKGRQYD